MLQTPACGRYDLIRMDVAWLDELAERIYRPLDQIPYDWDALLARTIPELGHNYSTAHGVRCCVPYDPSTQLLFYRRDLFTDPTYKRMYFEMFREELGFPGILRSITPLRLFSPAAGIPPLRCSMVPRWPSATWW